MKPEVLNAETNLNGKKERKQRVPQDAARITKGALNLPLEEKVALRNSLTDSIDRELKEMESKFNEAKKLINGQ